MKTVYILLTVFLSSWQAVDAQKAYSGKTIHGWIEPYAWDENDETIQISILVNPSDSTQSKTPEAFVDYVVENSRKGRELFAFIGQYAEVTGTIIADQDSIKQIRVEKYTILKDEPAADLDIE